MTAQQLPHHYTASARAQSEGDITLNSDGIPTLLSAPPAQYGGPGDKWSPEDLLVASVADCFVLTFRAITSASKMEWLELECAVEGKLERVDRITHFTAFKIKAKLTISADVDMDKAQRLLEKAESNCLISNSLHASFHLESEVIVQ